MLSLMLGVLFAQVLFFGIRYAVYYLETPKSSRELRNQRTSAVIAAAKQKPVKPTRSRASQYLIDAFNELPEANRPAYDLPALLAALDETHGIEAVDNHFSNYSKWGGWTCRCAANQNSALAKDTCRFAKYTDFKNTCRFAKYTDLWQAIRDIETEVRSREAKIARRERDAVLEGLKPDLAQLDALTDALRVEKTIINEVTREYV